jgi:hypothetical protein
MPDDWELRQRAKDAAIPKAGFRVVLVDTFDPPGEDLHVLADFETREEAEAFLKEKQKGNTCDKFFIYDPETR